MGKKNKGKSCDMDNTDKTREMDNTESKSYVGYRMTPDSPVIYKKPATDQKSRDEASPPILGTNSESAISKFSSSSTEDTATNVDWASEIAAEIDSACNSSTTCTLGAESSSPSKSTSPPTPQNAQLVKADEGHSVESAEGIKQESPANLTERDTKDDASSETREGTAQELSTQSDQRSNAKGENEANPGGKEHSVPSAKLETVVSEGCSTHMNEVLRVTLGDFARLWQLSIVGDIPILKKHVEPCFKTHLETLLRIRPIDWKLFHYTMNDIYKLDIDVVPLKKTAVSLFDSNTCMIEKVVQAAGTDMNKEFLEDWVEYAKELEGLGQ